MRIKLFTNQGFENQREIDDLWEGVGMCYNKTEDTCEVQYESFPALFMKTN
jgi:hypothetical protein